MRIQGSYGANNQALRQLFIAQPTNSAWGWYIGNQSGTFTTTDNDLYFTVQRNNDLQISAFVQDDADNVRMNFTGQHRSLVKDINYNEIKDNPLVLTGLIVVADQNEYMSMAGGLKIGQEAITIDESLPVLSLSGAAYSKKVFGVISGIESEKRQDEYGAWVTPYEKEDGDQRVFVNSVGERGIWVINSAGDLESGDYIVTSTVPGYGMRQNTEFLANYTVAKITMDCDFNPPMIPKREIKREKRVVEESEVSANVLDDFGRLQWDPVCDQNGEPILESAYKIRYIDHEGTIISKDTYDFKSSNGEQVYIAAFVGCTYHCG